MLGPSLRKRNIFKRGHEKEFLRFRGEGYLGNTDALEASRALKDGVVDIAFLDPPFNLGKNYGIATIPEALPSCEYERYMIDLLCELTRALKAGGALFMYHVPYWAVRLSPNLLERLHFRHWIAISMTNGFARGKKLYPAHYALVYFTKGEPQSFKRPKILPKLCRRCKKEQLKDYGGYQKIIDEKGLNLSDVWDDLSPVRHRREKYRCGNQLPLALTNRVVEIAGKEDGLLFDPFVGTGTSLVSATLGSMFFIGNDLEPRNLNICRRRLEETTGLESC